MPHHRCGTYASSAVYPVHRYRAAITPIASPLLMMCNTRRVTTIAVRTYTKVGVAGYNGTHLTSTEFALPAGHHHCSCSSVLRGTRNVRGTRFQHIFRRHTTQNADHAAALHVATPSITGVIRIPSSCVPQSSSPPDPARRQPDDGSDNRSSQFQCGIRQTFTRTVRGDEVLEYVQTFTEVRGDWRSMRSFIWLSPLHQRIPASRRICAAEPRAHRSRPSCRCCLKETCSLFRRHG